MKTEILKEKYIKYNLTKDDVFKHQHYIIITRSGIEKIAAIESIGLSYEVIKCEPNFAVIKCKADNHEVWIETFGSALKGDTYKDGNTNTWYVMEMAEKRAMSRAVLKLCGFYELGVFGEDESEDFKKNNNLDLTITNKENGKKKAKKDEIAPGIKFPSKDELRKMYLTLDDLASLKVLEERKL